MTLLRIFLCLFLLHTTLWAVEADMMFDQLKGSLFQIQVRGSTKKSVIGSGFRIAEGVIATNFHVISLFANEPEPHKIYAIDIEGNEYQVSLINLDPVSDLALLRGKIPQGKVIGFGLAEALKKGEALFALGNPRDLGLTIVRGSFSGRLQEGLVRRLHFTGSLNGGMSGGPAVNSEGELVGINVARTGEQIGFLVGEERLRRLLQENKLQNLNQKKQIEKLIERRLHSYQNELSRAVVSSQWDIDTLGRALVPANPAKLLNCWGGDQEEEQGDNVERGLSCSLTQDVFLGDFERTGTLDIEHLLVENKSWNQFQFSSYLNDQWTQNGLSNLFGLLDAPEEECIEERVERKDGLWRQRLCVQAHKTYKNIYNVRFKTLYLEGEGWSVISTLRLTGFSEKNALRLVDHFREALTCLP